MAAAIPFAPMIIGAGAGALIDKGNPMRGAMLGAVGGSAVGPMFSAATTGLSGAGAGIMAGSQAAGIPMGLEQAAMLGTQAEGMGAAGITNALTSGGANPMLAKGLGFATAGPQGLFGSINGKDLAMQGAKGLFQMGAGGQQQPTPMMGATPMPAPPPRQAPPPQQQFIPMSSRRMIRPRRSY